MNESMILTAGLALLNAVAVLVLMRSGLLPRREPRSELALDLDAGPDTAAVTARESTSALASEEVVDAGLSELIEEAERLERLERPDTRAPRGEARLAADLGRWRTRGENRPLAAGSRRAEAG